MSNIARKAGQSRCTSKLMTSASLFTLISVSGFAGQAFAQTIILDGNTVTVTSQADGEVISADVDVISTVDGAPVVLINNNDVTLDNDGILATLNGSQTVQAAAGTTGAIINNSATGVLEGDSRVVQIDGTGATLNNDGEIIGTGNQRNGTAYTNATATDFTLNNTGIIDAGDGNEGAGFSAEGVAGGTTINIDNSGLIQGRGQAGAGAATAGDGIRFERTRVAGMLDGTTSALFSGTITNSGIIDSESTQGTAAGIRFVNGVSFNGTIDNSGVISGVQNGLYFGNPTPAGGGDFTGAVVNNSGTISSDSRAFNLDGTGLTVNNSGEIIGTGNQRNGTFYADGTADDFTLNNLEDGIIDAGDGNTGSGVGIEIGGAEDGANTFTLINDGTIQGRGDAAAGTAAAGDGIRIGNVGNIGTAEATIVNNGLIASEGANGTVAGVRFVNGISFAGTFDNNGTITGVQNGVYFGNPVMGEGADHSNGVFNNNVDGVISSDSRAFNIDGLGLTLNNAGDILGTGAQRNGTLYADGTATDFTVNNSGTIDAVVSGSGFAAEIGPDGNAFTFDNSGTIAGRGQGDAATGAAGDGFRVGNVGNIGTATVAITNSGSITSESLVGTTAGLRFVNGISFAGTIDNSGTISGAQNGVYFGNSVMGEGADHSNGVFNNLAGGTISSDSRAFNIDGLGLTVNNAGQIIGTGNQRNGTVYADGTATDFTVNNSGTIDAGEGFDGSGFAAEIGADGNTFTFDNSGDIIGRGQGAFSDGFRVGNGGNIGVATVDITNTGTITSESTGSGAVSALRFVNGVSFAGVINNSGTIAGAQNGVYFGNPVMGEGADHSNGVFNNLAGGTISSDSRAFNIDGLGLTVNNAGQIIGTGNQRNGTVYADGTADAYTLNNLAGGVIDAGAGNSGSGVSLQSGDVDGDTVSFTITNDGTIAGRGDALPSGAAAGLRVFGGAADVTVDGDITNTGTISSETAAAILIEGVNYTGTITNSGTLTGPAAFDASTALGAINFVNNSGALNGDFIGSSFTDTLTFQGASTLAGSILGDVNTTLDAGSLTTVSGINTIEGDFTANGALNFQLGLDRLDVIGDSTLGADSIINISTDADVTNLILDTPVFVLTETGDFTNNGTTVNINVNDDDLLVDFDVVFGSVAVVATAADLSQISDDANISSFGGALTSAFAAGALDSAVANALNDADGVAGFENAALSLLPTLNEGVTREVFETHGQSDLYLQRRLASDADRGLWIQGFGRTAVRATDDRSTVGYNADAFGVSVGADANVNEALTIGAAFNYASIDIDNAGIVGEETELDSFQVSAYAGYRSGASFVNGQLGYIFGNGDTERAGATGPITGEADVNGFTAQGTAGYAIENGAITLTPKAGFRFASLSQDAFSEAGGLNLAVDPSSTQYLDLRVGADLAADFGGFQPFARASYVYDVIGDARAFDVNFTGSAAPFSLETTDPSQSRLEIGTGFNLVSGNGFTIGFEYNGEFSNDYQSHGGFLRARVAF